MSSTNSLDGGTYQRLRDYSDMEDGLGRDVHHQHGIYAYSQPSTRPATPGIGPGSAGVAPSAGSLSAATARAKKTTKKGRRMAWLLIHHTGEVQTVHMDKRQLIQARDSGAAACNLEGGEAPALSSHCRTTPLKHCLAACLLAMTFGCCWRRCWAWKCRCVTCG